MTGKWSIRLTVGEEQCVVLLQKVACMPGFNDDGKGRCECPSGTQNNAGICELTDCSDGTYRKRSEVTTAQQCETCILSHFCLANSSVLNCCGIMCAKPVDTELVPVVLKSWVVIQVPESQLSLSWSEFSTLEHPDAYVMYWSFSMFQAWWQAGR